MKKKEFKSRRDKLLKQIGANGIAIIFAAKEYLRSGSSHYPYRQNSDFYYLTGFIEPEAIAVFIPGRKDGEFILFNREHDAEKEVWNGSYAGQEGACLEFGADQSFPITHVDVLLPQLLVGREYIYFNFGSDCDVDAKINFWIEQVKLHLKDSAKDKYKLVDLKNFLSAMRIKKSELELSLMRKAIDITAEGHLRAMKKCCPGSFEFELKAEILYEFTRLGGSEAYETMVGSGANASILHYSKSDNKLVDGDLVLVDAGAEYKCYGSDVSRTFPVNGKFSSKQRCLYEAVLETQLEVIKQIRSGIRFNVLQSVAERVITEHLVRLGLLLGNVDDLLANQSFKRFFMHKIGHWIGLDAHDVGEYYTNNNEWCILEPGMVLTIEPGIYISSDVGIRIEDEILVLENGCEILTKAIPKTVTEIEGAMKR